jgi:ABC-type branched-subunit amino acid transport system substrate-binding protein
VRVRGIALLLAAAAVGGAIALVVAAGSPANSSVGPIPTMTVYSSLDTSFGPALDVERAEGMALADHGGGAGGFQITHVRLHGIDPGDFSENARRAAQDPAGIAYLSEFNSGDAEISIPITNEAGLLEVGATNTYVGLTRAEGAAERGEPSRYYPASPRTFARVVPSDRLQARAVARLLKGRHVRSVFYVDDGSPIGRSQTKLVAARARALGIRSAGRKILRRAAIVAARVRASSADAVYYGGFAGFEAGSLWKRVHADRPSALLVTGEDTDDLFLKRLGARAAGRTLVVEPTLARHTYNAKARSFDRRFLRRYHHHPSPYGLYGYASMDAVLKAITAASRDGGHGGERRAVRDKFFATRRTQSVLGHFRIDKYGDTTLARFTVRRVTSHGRLVFSRTITAG